MKQQDIAMIIVIAAVSAVLSFFVSSKIFVTPSNRQQSVEVIDPIRAEFSTPSAKYFNSDSNNPTQDVTIGDDNNTDPFRAQ